MIIQIIIIDIYYSFRKVKKQLLFFFLVLSAVLFCFVFSLQKLCISILLVFTWT